MAWKKKEQNINRKKLLPPLAVYRITDLRQGKIFAVSIFPGGQGNCGMDQKYSSGKSWQERKKKKKKKKNKKKKKKKKN